VTNGKKSGSPAKAKTSTKGVARRGPKKVNTLKPQKTAPLQPRVTVVGPGQGIRVTYPDDKTGGLITSSFVKRLRSSDANQVAAKVGKGRHVYGSLKLTLYEEPAFVDAGKPQARVAGKALVIGNDKYDETKRMGSVGPMNTVLSSCVKDAKAAEKALKKQGFAVTRLVNQTGTELKAALKQAETLLEANKRFVFHFSGHGSFEGLIGTDGGTASPDDVAKLVEKAIAVGADLSILADACHQGVTVDRCRALLLDRARKHNSNRKTALAFISSATALARHKKTFEDEGHKVWQSIWRFGEKPPPTENQGDQFYKDFQTLNNKWKTVWAKFVTSAQPEIDAAVAKAKPLKLKFRKLTLKAIPAKTEMEQDQTKKIWAQLDSVDHILNAAATLER
jgi:hypothetical protein